MLPVWVARAAALKERILDPYLSTPLRDLVLKLQESDEWIQRVVERLKSRRLGRDLECWSQGKDGELLYKGRLFVPVE